MRQDLLPGRTGHRIALGCAGAKEQDFSMAISWHKLGFGGLAGDIRVWWFSGKSPGSKLKAFARIDTFYPYELFYVGGFKGCPCLCFNPQKPEGPFLGRL